MHRITLPEYPIIAAGRIECATSRSGLPLPTLHVQFEAASALRLRKAVLHMLAARLEAITPPTETWVVYIEQGSDLAGAIHVELGTADEGEVRRAMYRLRQSAH